MAVGPCLQPLQRSIDHRKLLSASLIQSIQGFVVLALDRLLLEIWLEWRDLATSIGLNGIEPSEPLAARLAQCRLQLMADLRADLLEMIHE
jgi:hypothetical protein